MCPFALMTREENCLELWCFTHQRRGVYMQEEKAEWIIYVTDEGQSGHFKLVFGSGKKWGIIPEDNPPRIDHVGFGLVLGADGKRIRTRDMGAVCMFLLCCPSQHVAPMPLLLRCSYCTCKALASQEAVPSASYGHGWLCESRALHCRMVPCPRLKDCFGSQN